MGLVFLKKATKPPMSGAGKGEGMPGGGWRAKNKADCPVGGPGCGKGMGKGKGMFRKKSEIIEDVIDRFKNAHVMKGFNKLPVTLKRAYAAGAQVGLQGKLPSEEVFAKVSAATKIPVPLLKCVYIKQAVAGTVLPGLVGTALATYGLGKGVNMLRGGPRVSGEEYGPHMGTIGGIDPKSMSQLHKMISRSALRNYQMSELLNQMRAANPMSFRPMG